MKRRFGSFNNFFALLCLAAIACGCAEYNKITGADKELTVLHLYLEGDRGQKTTTGSVLVTRAKIPFNIEREGFLDEGDLSKASIVQNPDGTFAIQLQFNDHGTLLLDMYTADHKGKHIIILAQFPKPGHRHKSKTEEEGTSDEDLVEKTPGSTPAPEVAPGTTNAPMRESAWLAAVLIRDRISSGLFRFTPDCTRPEANRIVRGLRNAIAKESAMEKF